MGDDRTQKARVWRLSRRGQVSGDAMGRRPDAKAAGVTGR